MKKNYKKNYKNFEINLVGLINLVRLTKCKIPPGSVLLMNPNIV